MSFIPAERPVCLHPNKEARDPKAILGWYPAKGDECWSCPDCGAFWLERPNFKPNRYVQVIKEKSVKKTYAYHKPSPTGIATIGQLREHFSNLHDIIEKLAPNSREKSVALTNLETAAMWAIKAVVIHDPESEVAP